MTDAGAQQGAAVVADVTSWIVVLVPRRLLDFDIICIYIYAALVPLNHCS